MKKLALVGATVVAAGALATVSAPSASAAVSGCVSDKTSSTSAYAACNAGEGAFRLSIACQRTNADGTKTTKVVYGNRVYRTASTPGYGAYSTASCSGGSTVIATYVQKY